ncbi:DUF349 domain-containing protein [Pseudoduganella buxea]|uniref:DUF349 domain-containing protein n=1 Tax=Pseudoduganella buxea TaxID=1949069 RepID=A0A6I3T3Z8_9BURK|nr:DUF349 domain-containing protein [Pseudoduganella buxea]MTV56251.1 DUF349 domain-containing protein [Pseudoduganella buxea]GGB88870.1 hypothetical protein GCM10011572_08710 [Pseudoduganella buxea]
MFEFLFKRPGDKGPDSNGSDSKGPDPRGSDPRAGTEGGGRADGAADAAARRAAQVEAARALAGNEAGAVELILQSEFADVRLAAAEHVVSQPMLERVQQAVRNTDRRVAKLVQGRLDAIRHAQAEQRQAELSISTAERLLADEKLTPNQVADLDRLWQVIAAPAELAERFGVLRAQLGARLEAQVTLQRSVRDALAAVRRFAAAPDEAELERLGAAHAAHLADPERATLPRHLLNDFDAALAEARAALAARAPAAAVSAAPAEDIDVHTAGVNNADVNAADTTGAGGTAAAASEPGDATPASTPAATAPPEAAQPPRPPREKHKATPADKEANARFMALVDAMEAALEAGQLHTAAEHDKALKDSKTGRLTPQQAERLAHIRGELKRLSAWARWGGNVSREEMVHAVEELPGQGLSMSELARKVSAMRERWKALDNVSGAAPKSLWEKFDAACTAAYAPAAAHFKHLADERHGNAAKAQAMIDEVHALIADSPAAREDWRALASVSQRLRQAWSRLGTIDRKDKKKLDSAFGKAMETLMAPLEGQRAIEVARREQLIEEVYKLNPADRHTVDTLRGLQESWQGHAKALPLERKQEQALWQKFRAACDTIFAKRKESAHAADHERKVHLHAREAVCEALENASFDGDDKAQLAAIGKALKDAASAWHAAGVVPRAAEQRIEQRYRAAVARVQAIGDALRKRAGAAQANALRDKLRLVQALETAVAGTDAVDGNDWNGRWQALPGLGGDTEKALRGRFDAALKAAEGAARAAYGARLAANGPRLLAEVLRLEIVAGIDSGAEFARERLKMQVEVLQDSLKSGHKAGHGGHAAQLAELCALPALADDRTVSRIEQLLRRVGTGA